MTKNSSMNTIRTNAADALADIMQAITENPGTGQVRQLVKFLAGLYNSFEYPFPLRDLRGLDQLLFQACLTYLAYDALGDSEVHQLIPGGAKRLNQLFEEYGLRPHQLRLTDIVGEVRELRLNASLVTYGNAPGYRGVHLVFDVAELADDGDGTARASLNVGAADSLAIAEHVREVQRFAWSTPRGPIDKREGERRPGWIG